MNFFEAKLITSGRESLVYQYRTEVKLSVANGQYDLQNEITANVHIKSLGDCNYAIQVNICNLLIKLITQMHS